ncbi:Tetraspanin family-domain-containing protein [Blastocladiella britannica]|nr:Tetraspanin family-domain-containing protein [Blastocladiella britannica]
MAGLNASWFSRLNRIRGAIWVLKNLVMLVNLFALIVSIGFFIVGIVGYSSDSLVGIISSSLPAACIALGVIMALISLVGCFGAANESTFFMRVYFGFLAVMIVSEFVIGGVAYSHKGNIEMYLSQTWSNAYTSDKSIITRIQNMFSCCGLTTVSDMSVPVCPTQTPCYAKVKSAFTNNLNSVATAAISLAVLELVCMLAAGLLVYFSNMSEDARNNELLEEAHKLAVVEQERAKSAKYNFESPFDVGDDDE